MIILFDDYCKICRKTIKVISKLDWFNFIIFKPLRNISKKEFPSGLDDSLYLKQMASFTNKWRYGYDTIFEIVKRLPLFWIFIPLFWVLKITRIGNKLYIMISVNRKIIPLHCNGNCELK